MNVLLYQPELLPEADVIVIPFVITPSKPSAYPEDGLATRKLPLNRVVDDNETNRAAEGMLVTDTAIIPVIGVNTNSSLTSFPSIGTIPFKGSLES